MEICVARFLTANQQNFPQEACADKPSRFRQDTCATQAVAQRYGHRRSFSSLLPLSLEIHGEQVVEVVGTSRMHAVVIAKEALGRLE